MCLDWRWVPLIVAVSYGAFLLWAMRDVSPIGRKKKPVDTQSQDGGRHVGQVLIHSIPEPKPGDTILLCPHLARQGTPFMVSGGYNMDWTTYTPHLLYVRPDGTMGKAKHRAGCQECKGNRSVVGGEIVWQGTYEIPTANFVTER